MKIDSHQHYWRYRAQDYGWINDTMPVLRQDRMPADCQPAMRDAGIAASIAVQARSAEADTDDLLQLARGHPSIVGVVGWTDLRSAHLASRLERWQHQPLLRGFRHVLQDEPEVGAVVEDPAFNRGVHALQRQGLTYDVLVFERQIQAVVAFCARQDAHWLIVDHLGKPDLRHGHTAMGGDSAWLAGLRALAAMPHVMCKLSGVVTEMGLSSQTVFDAPQRALVHACFDHALACFGPGRLMFGSDWPVCELATPFAVVAELAWSWAESRLSPSEQAAFWGGNATRAYGLTLPPSH